MSEHKRLRDWLLGLEIVMSVVIAGLSLAFMLRVFGGWSAPRSLQGSLFLVLLVDSVSTLVDRLVHREWARQDAVEDSSG